MKSLDRALSLCKETRFTSLQKSEGRDLLIYRNTWMSSPKNNLQACTQQHLKCWHVEQVLLSPSSVSMYIVIFVHFQPGARQRPRSHPGHRPCAAGLDLEDASLSWGFSPLRCCTFHGISSLAPLTLPGLSFTGFSVWSFGLQASDTFMGRELLGLQRLEVL